MDAKRIAKNGHASPSAKNAKDAKNAKTPQDFPKTGSRFLQSWINGLGNQKLQLIDNCSNHPALQAAKHLSGDGGMRGAFE